TPGANLHSQSFGVLTGRINPRIKMTRPANCNDWKVLTAELVEYVGGSLYSRRIHTELMRTWERSVFNDKPQFIKSLKSELILAIIPALLLAWSDLGTNVPLKVDQKIVTK